MRLSEIMSNADLTIFPKVALIIFIGVFILVTLRTMTMSRRQNVDELARLALDDNDSIGGDAR